MGKFAEFVLGADNLSSAVAQAFQLETDQLVQENLALRTENERVKTTLADALEQNDKLQLHGQELVAEIERLNAVAIDMANEIDALRKVGASGSVQNQGESTNGS